MRSREQVQQERHEAVLAFQQDRERPIEVEPGHGAAREARQEHERRVAVRQRELAALLARREHPVDPAADERPRAVVLHRQPWMRSALCAELVRAGVVVVADLEDGAAGLGTVVAEQPDLVVVEQQLPWVDGLEVVREVRRYAPAARVAVHLDQPGAEPAAREAGAHEVFARATRAQDMVARLTTLASV
ncbi:MAG: Two component transcriptional regulator, LuxR family [Frankiales bacterium]|nr:Two component transcriptional regulator, LuxR family [Frankiales bacterium]